jgi:chemotaxis protein MotB
MSKEPDTAETAEIVIVRRGNRGGEDGHHGGVWKIAYADFMTAMMAFFLVMWLVNAANEKTKQQVASYFNPIKLIDTRTNEKGLQSIDSGSSEPGKRGDPSGARRGTESEEGGHSATPETTASDDDVASGSQDAPDQPEAPVLKDILLIQGLTGQQGLDPSRPAAEETTSPERTDMAGQHARQDASAAEPARVGSGQAAKADAARDSDGELARKPLLELMAKAEQMSQTELDKPVEPEQHAPASEASPQAPEQPSAVPDGKVASTAEKIAERGPADAGDEGQASEKRLELLESVQQKIRQSGYTPLVDGLALNVEETREGVLISVAESTSTAMFDIATATPSPALVKLAGQVANVLKSVEGQIIIRGHTDGRQYFTAEQDNWSLSANRAHAAYRLLLDAGLPAVRFQRIEGYADTSLKVKADPLAASNRRVEVLLRADRQAQ